MAEPLPNDHDFPAPEATRRATAPSNPLESCHDLLNQVRFTPGMVKGSALMDLSDGETQAFRHLAHSIISRTLAHQNAYQLMNCPELSRGDWKLLKRQNDLSVYRRRLPTHHEQARGLTEVNRRMVLCVGTMAGSLEDVLYGVHAKTREEMQLTAPHVSKGHLDCTMLVSVYAKGMFDLGGDTPSFLMNNTSCSLMLSIPRAVASSEAKRLTLLAVRKAASSVSASCGDLSTEDDLDGSDLSVDSLSSGYSNSAHSVSGEVASVAPPTLRRFLSKGKPKSRSKRQQAGSACCVCAKQPAMASIVAATHRSCGVCQRSVCTKCRVKRQLYARARPVVVTCCKSCLVEAKQLALDPQEPCPILL